MASFIDYESTPPDAIVDESNRRLVGPVLIFYEDDKYHGRCVVVKLSNYLNKKLIEEYGVDKANPAHHPHIRVFRKTKYVSGASLQSELRLFDVFVEYMPRCVLSSVFSERMTYPLTCSIVPTFTGNPVVVTKDSIDNIGVESAPSLFKSVSNFKFIIQPEDKYRWLEQRL